MYNVGDAVYLLHPVESRMALLYRAVIVVPGPVTLVVEFVS